jgi:hypothetical protein
MTRPPEPDARVVDDKMAQARKRAGRIQNDAAPDKASTEAIDTEDRQKERATTDKENDKSRGNGDDAIEDAAVSGQPDKKEDR